MKAKRIVSPFTPLFEQLPSTLPIFPLANALLTPDARLPLNIFEPRYLNMVADALKTDRLIGMVQPKPEPTTIRDASAPTIYEIGCAGRIVDYAETLDGRLEITLSGVCRFTIQAELPCERGYRLVRPDWSAFEADYDEIEDPDDVIYDNFIIALRHFLDNHNIPADWELFKKLSVSSLISSLVNVLPIETSERQMLLEADTLEDRIRAFTAILAGSVSTSHTRH